MYGSEPLANFTPHHLTSDHMEEQDQNSLQWIIFVQWFCMQNKPHTSGNVSEKNRVLHFAALYNL